MSLLNFSKSCTIHSVVLPVFKDDRIIDIELGKENGRAVLGSGMEISLNRNHVCLLDSLKFAKKLRVKFDCGRLQWMSLGRIWSSLKDVEVLIINGNFYQDVLEALLEKCTSLKALTCAYWKGFSFAWMFEKASSKDLSDLTIYVSETKDSSSKIYECFEAKAITTPKMIKNLFLIFEECLRGDISTTIYSIISRCLAPRANVYLFFKGESQSFCMNHLISDKYEFAGFMHIAENSDGIRAPHQPKDYVRYKLFQKTHGNSTFIIGCGKCKINQRAGNSCLSMVSPQLEQSWKSKNVGEFLFYEPAKAPYISRDDMTTGNQEEEIAFCNEFGPRCCDFEMQLLPENCSNPFFLPFCHLSSPRPSIDVVSLFHRKIEFQLSNGLHFQPMSMEATIQFLKNSTCLASESLRIHSDFKNACNGFIKFFRFFFSSANEIEFTGFWSATSLERFAREFPPHLNAIIMMRIDIDGLDIKRFIDAIPLKIRSSITKFFLDARSTSLMSLSSIVNALDVETGSIDSLFQVFIATRQIDDIQNPMTIEKCIKRLNVIVGNKANVILMIDQEIDDHILDRVNCQNPSEAVVPVKYDRSPSARKESYLMCIFNCKHEETDFKLLCPPFWI